jgi:hypothetical protein
MNRPIGVILIAIIALMMSVISLLKGLALAILGGMTTAIGTQASGSPTIMAGFILITSAPFAWAFANAAWTFKPSGWTFGLIAQELALLGAAVNIMQGSTLGVEIVSIVTAAVIITYLMTPNVRKAFGRCEPVAVRRVVSIAAR